MGPSAPNKKIKLTCTAYSAPFRPESSLKGCRRALQLHLDCAADILTVLCLQLQANYGLLAPTPLHTFQAHFHYSAMRPRREGRRMANALRVETPSSALLLLCVSCACGLVAGQLGPGAMVSANVGTAMELENAFATGTPHILITSHLALSGTCSGLCTGPKLVIPANVTSIVVSPPFTSHLVPCLCLPLRASPDIHCRNVPYC